MVKLPGAPFGEAKYIKAQKKPSDFDLYDPAPIFRKEFTVKEVVSSATVFVQSPGFVQIYLNGKPITEDKFISPVSDYRKILWFNNYDVTSLLNPGKNVICAICGNGFFNESFDSAWSYHTAEWRDAPQFLLALHIDENISVISDKSWKCSKEKSHIIYNHLRSGEYVDMRKYDPSWLTAGYDDSDWQQSIERDTPITGELRPVQCQPIREVEKIPPRSIQKVEKGYLVDFGVTISGYMEITLKAKQGSEILFRYTEDLFDDFSPNYHGMNNPPFYLHSPFHLNKLIASGKTDTFKPMFCYHGFRYVIIEGLEEAPDINSMCAYFTHQDIDRRAEFESGKEILNYIYNAGIRSTYSNLFWSLTDCPTREKLGWANDAQATAEQILINFDIVPLFKKWFEDLKSSMKSDGSLPGVIPSPDWGFEYGPICDGLLYELPYRVYLYTGDSTMLTESLEYFDRYVEFLAEKIEEKYNFVLGDWLGYMNSPRIPKKFVWEFYLIKALSVTVLAHKLAEYDAKAWEARLHKKREAFLANYLDTEGRCVIDEQSSIAMMLASGLFRDKKVLSEQLIAAIMRDNYKITSGMVGIQYLYDALTLCGRPDIAYNLITESNPGYQTWFEKGATTLWESWECDLRGGSQNHHMFSNVLAWFYKSLLGIVPREDFPAFERIDLHPCFIKEIGFVKGAMDTVRGRIEAEWIFENNHFTYTVTIPDNVLASFNGKMLSPGKNQFVIE